MRYSIFFVLVMATLASGCGAKLPSVKPFKLEIQQGNVVTSKMLLQLRPGMTRSQVRYIMGTPLIVDGFRNNRWDYFYELHKQGQVVEKRRVILDFDKDALTSVRGDVIPASENVAENATPVTPKPAEKETNWTDKLQVWKDDEQAAKVVAEPIPAEATLVKSEAVKAEPVPAAQTATTQTVETTPPLPSENIALENHAVEPANVAPATPVPETIPAPVQVAEVKAVENAAQAKVAEVKVEEPKTTLAKIEAAPVAPAKAEPAIAEAAKAEVSASPVADPKTVAVVEDEILPFIPEGEFVESTAPTPADMVKGNPQLPPVKAIEASGHPMATTVAESKAVIDEKLTANIQPVLPKEVKANPEIAANSVEARAPVDTVVEPVKPVLKAAPETTPQVPAKVAEPTSASIISSTIVEDEVVPFIPEGEYVEPVIPTPEEMEKGNLEADSAKPIVAETSTVTEKGVAPKEEAKMAAAQPVFVQENLPEPVAEPEPEPVLPPPVKSSVTAKSVPAVPVLTAPVVAEIKAVETQAPEVKAADVNPVEVKPADVKPVENKAVISNTVAPITQVSQVTQEMPVAQEMPTEKTAIVAPPVVESASKAKQTVAAKPVVLPPSAPVDTATSVTAVNATTEPPVVASSPTLASAEAPPGNVSIEYAVRSWAQAWRSKNVPVYLAAYAPDFVPEGVPSKKAWEAQRKQRLSPKQGAISLELEELDIQRDDNQATVKFLQKYAAKSYQDEVSKTLQLRYQPALKTWLIVRESSGAATSSARVAAVATPSPTASPVSTPSPVGTAPTVAAVPTPVSPAVANPPLVNATTAMASAGDAEIESAIQSWAQAWRSKNIPAYFATYAPDFVPEGLPSRSAWEAQRKQRLSPKQGGISLELGAVNIQRNGNEAVATFTQKYASKVYRDEMLKKLQLRYNPLQKVWQIVRETSSSDANMPAVKKQITAPEGSAEHLDGVLEQIGF